MSKSIITISSTIYVGQCISVDNGTNKIQAMWDVVNVWGVFAVCKIYYEWLLLVYDWIFASIISILCISCTFKSRIGAAFLFAEDADKTTAVVCILGMFVSLIRCSFACCEFAPFFTFGVFVV